MKTTSSRLSAIAAGVSLVLAIPTPAQAQKALGDRPVKPFFHWTLTEQQARFPAIEKTYQTTTIQKGAAVHELPASAKPIEPRILHAGRMTSLQDFMSANKISGVIAVKDGQVVLEKYADGQRPEDRWPSTGLAQAMTSTLIGAAIKEGWIRSQYDAVQRYLPELKGTAYEDVSLRRLMSMSSGVKWNNSYVLGDSDESKLASAMRAPGGLNPTVALAGKLAREAEPGQKHLSKSVDADLAGLALSSALAGKTLSQYASEKIWAPYGMERDAVWTVDAAGQEKASGPLSMTLRDAARFGQFLLDDGRIGDKQVLPSGWISEATSNQLNKGATGQAGYFWTPGADGSFEANGLYGQGFYVNPSEKLVIVVNGFSLLPDDPVQATARAALVSAVRKELTGRGQT